jgi:hypothetical protein
MSVMGELYYDIQKELEKGTFPATVARMLGISTEMVYDVLEQMEAMGEMPQEPMPTDDEIDAMAEFYGN